MRFVLSFFALLVTLTLVSRAAFPAPQLYTSGLDSHAHNDVSSDARRTVFLSGFFAHDHAEHGSDHDDSSAPSESSGRQSGHGHSHTHVLIESTAWIASDSAFNNSFVTPQIVSWSVAEDIYVFNFLSRIFRPPIA